MGWDELVQLWDGFLISNLPRVPFHHKGDKCRTLADNRGFYSLKV